MISNVNPEGQMLNPCLASLQFFDEDLEKFLNCIIF